MSQNQPLNPAKKKALADKVADSVHKEITHHINDLKSHEVSKGDTNQIVSDGIKRAIERVNEDLGQ